VLHGYTENYDIVPVRDSLILTSIYIGASLVIAIIAWLFYRNLTKANLLTFSLMAFQFFFGSIHDLIKKLSPDSFISKYSFILPGALLFFIGLIIVLKKTKKPLQKFSYYLNLLLVLFILMDAGWLLTRTISAENKISVTSSETVETCNDCKKPDIYFIIADGYPGHVELKEVFGYNNSPFESELKKRGFYITDSSRSNYNFTPFSISSMLNMDYLNGIVGSNTNKSDMALCYQTIKKSKTFGFFTQMGYNIYNYSIFDLYKQPSLAIPTFLPRKTTPITSQTFLARIEKQLGHHLATTFKMKFIIRYIRNRDLNNNNKIIAKTRKVVLTKETRPKFVYTHLVMPHYPYYFDSTGKNNSYTKLTEDFTMDQSAFISYLKYSNSKLIELIDHIKSSSPSPPVIILMSDHGFREFKIQVDTKYHFLNLNAVYFPDSNYSGFYPGMSNVNQFRVILNSQFKQHLPVLKDSTSYLLN
jgi:hypothetical protein